MGLVLGLSMLVRVFMDVLFKSSVRHLNFESVLSVPLRFLDLFKVPLFWVSVGLALVNFYLWSLVLAHFDLSYAYPLFSLCYVVIMISGRLFFREVLDGYKIVGMGLILVGSMILVVGS